MRPDSLRRERSELTAKKLILYVDGASRGNPGPSGIGVVVCDVGGRVIGRIQRTLGPATNNCAEYQALICGLEEALIQGASEVVIRSDSELVIRQSSGYYRVRSEHLKPLAEEVSSLKRGFKRVIFEQIPREQNKEADRLAKRASRKQSVVGSQ